MTDHEPVLIVERDGPVWIVLLAARGRVSASQHEFQSVRDSMAFGRHAG